jgi:hypothetical protein
LLTILLGCSMVKRTKVLPGEPHQDIWDGEAWKIQRTHKRCISASWNLDSLFEPSDQHDNPIRFDGRIATEPSLPLPRVQVVRGQASGLNHCHCSKQLSGLAPNSLNDLRTCITCGARIRISAAANVRCWEDFLRCPCGGGGWAKGKKRKTKVLVTVLVIHN